MLNAMMVGAGIGLVGSLLHWRRDRELDAQGNPCLRYCGPRFGVPLVGMFFLFVAASNLLDPFHVRHPENSVIEFLFVAASLLASLFFIPYRVTFSGDSIARHAWPLPTLRFHIRDIEAIEEGEYGFVLRLSDGRNFSPSPLLSGQNAFLARVRALSGNVSTNRASHG